MIERGVIKHREYKQQIADFSGLRFGAITPTDLDAFIDFNNKLFVFAEAKYNGHELPYGQRLALERLCDACHCPPERYSVAFIVSHTSKSDIDFASTEVVSYRWQQRWVEPKHKGASLRYAVESFKRLADKRYF